MFSAKKKPSAEAWILLQTAVADMSLHSTFQSILLSKFTCRLSALIRIQRSQTGSESSAVDFEGQTALFAIVGLPAQIRMCYRVLRQPLLERGIVRLDFDGFTGFIEIDAVRFLPLIPG